MTIIVLAKAPVPGRVKTRLCPPCDNDEAASLATAALVDTLTAVASAPCRRRVLALDGTAGPWLPAGFEVVAQRGDGLDARLAHAFSDVGEGGFLIGMDTPQLEPELLAESLRVLQTADVDAVLGPAVDGGWWGIGLRAPDPAVFLGVPMSTASTYEAQHARLRAVGLRVGGLPMLRDVDNIDDAVSVARDAPEGRFAETLRPMLPRLCGRGAALATG